MWWCLSRAFVNSPALPRCVGFCCWCPWETGNVLKGSILKYLALRRFQAWEDRASDWCSSKVDLQLPTTSEWVAQPLAHVSFLSRPTSLLVRRCCLSCRRQGLSSRNRQLCSQDLLLPLISIALTLSASGCWGPGHHASHGWHCSPRQGMASLVHSAGSVDPSPGILGKAPLGRSRGVRPDRCNSPHLASAQSFLSPSFLGFKNVKRWGVSHLPDGKTKAQGNKTVPFPAESADGQL